MFWNDHALPHFHAVYGEHEAIYSIESLLVIRGALPRRASALVLELAQEHRAELLEDWELCRSRQMPNKIQGLA